MNCLCFYCHSDHLKQKRVSYLKHLWAFHSLSFKFSMLTFVLCSLRWAETEFTQGGEWIEMHCVLHVPTKMRVCVGVGVVSGRYLDEVSPVSHVCLSQMLCVSSGNWMRLQGYCMTCRKHRRSVWALSSLLTWFACWPRLKRSWSWVRASQDVVSSGSLLKKP